MSQAFYDGMNKKGLSLEEFRNSGAFEFSYNFSPGQADLMESYAKQVFSNGVQKLIGGATVFATPDKNDENIIHIEVVNKMSRNSLLLHVGENYETRSQEVEQEQPLSTTIQRIKFSITIDVSKVVNE